MNSTNLRSILKSHNSNQMENTDKNSKSVSFSDDDTEFGNTDEFYYQAIDNIGINNFTKKIKDKNINDKVNISEMNSSMNSQHFDFVQPLRIPLKDLDDILLSDDDDDSDDDVSYTNGIMNNKIQSKNMVDENVSCKKGILNSQKYVDAVKVLNSSGISKQQSKNKKSSNSQNKMNDNNNLHLLKKKRKRSKCPSSKKIRKQINESYTERHGSYFKQFPLKRLAREKEKAAKRKISKREIWNWKNATDDILSHKDQAVWFEDVLKSTGNETQKECVVNKQLLENRKKMAKFLSHMNFIEIKEIMNGNEKLFEKHLSGHDHQQKFTATPEKNVLFVIMDMTKDESFITTKKQEGSYKEIGNNCGYLYLDTVGMDVTVYVPTIIIKLKSILNCPETSWKSFAGTRNATEKIYADRSGVHSSTLQLLDKQIEDCKDGVDKKFIVVHDDSIEFSADSDVVNCFVQDLSCILAHKIGSQNIVCGENVVKE